jgi:hypothetical protein
LYGKQLKFIVQTVISNILVRQQMKTPYKKL